MLAFSASSHGTTFGGHPVSCAAALAEVNELYVKEVRHQGLLVGVGYAKMFWFKKVFTSGKLCYNEQDLCLLILVMSQKVCCEEFCEAIF